MQYDTLGDLRVNRIPPAARFSHDHALRNHTHICLSEMCRQQPQWAMLFNTRIRMEARPRISAASSFACCLVLSCLVLFCSLLKEKGLMWECSPTLLNPYLMHITFLFWYCRSGIAKKAKDAKDAKNAKKCSGALVGRLFSFPTNF